MRLAGVLALGLAGVFGLLLIAVAVGSTPLGVARVVDVVLAGPGTEPISRIVIAAAGLAAVGALAVLAHRPLDALLAGDDAAVTLGVNVTRFRQVAFLVCAFATASFVALSGVIGFIGLMVPHLARGLVGPLHGALASVARVRRDAMLDIDKFNVPGGRDRAT